MERTYQKTKRAEAENETREKIVNATMALHVDKGVAATSFTDVAARAGVGTATVYRHFPTVEDLIGACGERYWREIDPPSAANSDAVFLASATPAERTRRLAQALNDFYSRAEGPLWSALRDRDRFEQLQSFLLQVRSGIRELAAEALGLDAAPADVKTLCGLLDFMTWRALGDAGVTGAGRLAAMEAISAIQFNCRQDR